MVSMEQWNDVVGYEGLYEVSNLGRVRNKRTYNILKPTTGHWGYYKLNLHKDGVMKSKTIHRLVAEAWIPQVDCNKDQINHINEIKTDNRVENLEWCTVEYNNKYGTHIDRVYKTLVDRGYIKHPERRYLSEEDKCRLYYLEHKDKARRMYIKKKVKSLLSEGRDIPLW